MNYSIIRLNHFMLVQRNTYICECKKGNTAESWLNQKANGDIREHYYSFLLTSAWKGIGIQQTRNSFYLNSLYIREYFNVLSIYCEVTTCNVFHQTFLSNCTKKICNPCKLR